jgi:hypothetical protein
VLIYAKQQISRFTKSEKTLFGCARNDKKFSEEYE